MARIRKVPCVNKYVTIRQYVMKQIMCIGYVNNGYYVTRFDSSDIIDIYSVNDCRFCQIVVPFVVHFEFVLIGSGGQGNGDSIIC